MARRWVVETPVPSSPKARIVEVEASEHPIFIVGGHHQRPITATTKWPGKATYFVPADSGAVAEVMGICKACSDCKTPSTAFVRFSGERPIASWRLEASSAPYDVLLDPDKELRTTFSLTASDGKSDVRPDFRIVGDDMRIRDTIGGDDEKLVFWTKPPFRMVVTIKASISIEGPCPTETQCEPPPGAKLAITNIVTEDINAPAK